MSEFQQVALTFMNEDHQQAADLLDCLDDLISRDHTDEIEGAYLALLAHCQEHFERENQLMQEYKFPPIGCHKGEHDQVLLELQTELEHWKEKKDKARLQELMTRAFPSWLKNHIATMDNVTAQFIEQRQQKMAEA